MNEICQMIKDHFNAITYNITDSLTKFSTYQNDRECLRDRTEEKISENPEKSNKKKKVQKSNTKIQRKKNHTTREPNSEPNQIQIPYTVHCKQSINETKSNEKKEKKKHTQNKKTKINRFKAYYESEIYLIHDKCLLKSFQWNECDVCSIVEWIVTGGYITVHQRTSEAKSEHKRESERWRGRV